MTSLDAQIELLRTTGDQFTDDERHARRAELPNVLMLSDDGVEPALYDTEVIPAIPYMLAPSARVHQDLSAVRPTGVTHRAPDSFLGATLMTDSLIVGISGYGTGDGYNYDVEHDGITGIFEHARDNNIPIDHVVDGGTGYGVPGLSGALAQKHGLATVGYAPLRSLRGAAPRDSFVVLGNEFGDEAPALGAVPDVLVAFGGDKNALKEVEAARSLGTTVILATFKKYPERSIAYLTERRATGSEALGKLVLCKGLEEVASIVDSLYEHMDTLKEARVERAVRLQKVLAPTP